MTSAKHLQQKKYHTLANMHHTLHFSPDKSYTLIFCCQMQGELEGSVRYRELMRSAENFFNQSVASKSR